MTDTPCCPRCGAHLVRALNQAMCPACLMASALEEPNGTDAPASEDFSFGIPYQIVTLIARHADGVTYLATAAGSSHHVALRIVGPRADAAEILERARAWTPTLTLVRHPHIARLLDAGPAAEGCVYMAAEYIGGPVLSFPACRERLTTTHRHSVVVQLTDALDLLRSRGLAHMRLDASRVKIAAREDSVHATVIGLGIGTIVDGLRSQPERDAEALAAIARSMDVDA